ncbi:MAG: propane 2-monooxygenase effector subunit MimD [Rubrobacteraceae bacterium]
MSERQEYAQEHTSSNRCGVTMSASVEGNIVAEVMGEKPGVEVRKFPAMIRIDAENRIEFDLDEIAEAIGVEDFSPEDFEIETSTHYGRMVREDDRVLLFANPEDAAEYIGFDLPSQG